MPAEYNRWWMNRVGQLAAATTTAAQPEPLYGAAVDFGTAPTQPQTYEDMLNSIMLLADEQNQQRWLDQMALQGAPAPLPEPEEEVKPIKGWGDFFGDLGTNNPLKNLGARAGFIINELAGVDDATGINRTERKWLEAQGNQAGEISLQHDAELDPELVNLAREALETGQWDPRLEAAYAQYQGKDPSRFVPQALEWMEENIYQEEIARPTSAAFQQIGLLTAGESDALASDTWREAWERTENISPGQAIIESALSTVQQFDPVEAYEDGFDEAGNPVNQAYADLRRGTAYNIASGTTDFAIRWFGDPLAIGGKTVGVSRAISKADWDRMPKLARQRIMHIVSTPSDRWNEVQSGISKADLLGQRAIALRNNMHGLKEQVRANPQEWDAVKLAESVPALRDDLLAADMFRQLALRRQSAWDAEAGVGVAARTPDGLPKFDDDIFETGVAALMGNGMARAELAQSKELGDYLYALSTDESALLADDLNKLKRLEELEAQLARDEVRHGRVLTAAERWARVRSMRDSMEEMSRRGDELSATMAEYESYNRFMAATLDSPDTDWLRLGQFKPKERKYNRITHRTLKPSGAAGVTATVTHVPRAAWLKRSSAIDLSGHQGLQTQAPRILNEAKATVNNADHLNAYANSKNFASWDEMERDLLNRAAATRTEGERLAVAEAIEDASLEVVAAKHELTVEEATSIMSRIKGRQGEMFADIKKRALDARAAGVSPDEMHRYDYAEGTTLYHLDLPVSLTQLSNYKVPISAKDMDRFLNTYGDAVKGSLRYSARRGKEIGTDLADIFNTYWKVGVLFRFGYPIRNVSEESFRILAHTGSFTNLLADMPRAGAVGMLNTGKRVANFMARHSPSAARWKGARFAYTTQQGQSSRRIRVRDDYEFDSSFAPGSGDVWLSLNSSGASVDRLAQHYSSGIQQLRRTSQPLRKSLEGEEGHAAAWAEVLNNHVRYDPIYQRMLAGETDDAIVRDLKGTMWGRELRDRHPVRGSDPEKWVEAYRANLDELVPDDVMDLRIRLANNEEIPVEDLQTIIDDTGRYSPVSIDEAALELSTGRGAFAKTVDGFVEKGYHVLATLPTDVLARNPFFDRQYRAFLTNLVDDLPDSYKLSAAQERAFSAQARSFALKQVKRYLFNTVDNDTDLIRWFRFLSPFMGAWKESMVAWGRVMTENPEAFARLYVNGWASMGDLFFVTETDMNGRTEDDPLHGDLDRLQVAVPKGMIKALGHLVPGDTGKRFRDTVDELATEDGAVRVDINKSTLNTTLQGDPFWLPGGGAIIQVAGQQALGDMPELADENAVTSFLYSYLFPIGVPDDAIDAIMPTLARRVRRWAAGVKDPVFSNTATLLYKSEWYEWDRGGRVGPPPDEVEVIEKAKAIQAAYVVGAALSPFTFELQSDNEFFVEKAHQYQEEYGFEEGYPKFIEDFGDDVYYFWYTNSKNNVGVPPTSEGWKMTKKHEDLIARYPNIGLAIVGMNTQDSAFNYNVWSKQGQTETFPGSGIMMREKRTPEEALAYAQEQEGWRRWRELSVAIDAELVARGIVDVVNGETVAGSIQRKGAEDLQLLKAQYREQMREQLPGWSDSYDQIDRGKSYEVVDEFRGVLRSGMMGARIEWEGAAQYMELHDAVAAELDARAAAGGSANIEVESNRDLNYLFTANVARIVQGNLAFADVYHRYLERHVLSNGSNGAILGVE